MPKLNRRLLSLWPPRLWPIGYVPMTLIVVMLSLSNALYATERFVAMAHESAIDAGLGDDKNPYKTITYAMAQLKPGDTLTILAGTYREALIFQKSVWEKISPATIQSGNLDSVTFTPNQQTLIQGQGHVLIKGSDIVQDWRSLGHGRFVKVWKEEPQQVFINDKALTQIGGTIFNGYPINPRHPLAALHQSQQGIWPGRIKGDVNAMPENSFYYDHARQALYLQAPFNSLKTQHVEVSVRPTLISAQGVADITVKHLHLSHSNTSTLHRSGLVAMSGVRITLDDVHVSRADSVGFALIGDDIQIRNVSANQCGQLGILARGARMQLINNQTNDNNTRGFNKWWEAGGVKFVGNGGLQDGLLSQHQALRNTGDGIWFDWKNRNNTIEHSLSAYNTGFGIHYEASDQGRILNNVVIANHQRGIYLSHASHTLVAFNLVASNRMQGIAVVEESRRDPAGKFDFSANHNQIIANVIAWNAGAIVLPTELANNTSDFNVVIGQDAQTRSGLGWVNMLMVTPKDWTQRTQQDQHAQHRPLPSNFAFQQSIKNETTPNLKWYETLRDHLTPITLNNRHVDFPSEYHDLRPGPNLDFNLPLGVSSPLFFNEGH